MNARIETAATRRTFKPICLNGRAICCTDGWFEWKREGDKEYALGDYRKRGSRWMTGSFADNRNFNKPPHANLLPDLRVSEGFFISRRFTSLILLCILYFIVMESGISVEIRVFFSG
ncbi:TPA: hypothetical protein I8287_004056 [Kluyvera intermedia]|nr:hypothetical protein [Kluyvera intermedia]